MFEKTDALELWEADDHWVIQYLRKDAPLVGSQFLTKPTSADVKVLCKYFGVPYDRKWVIYHLGDKERNGAQITIHKPPTDWRSCDNDCPHSSFHGPHGISVGCDLKDKGRDHNG